MQLPVNNVTSANANVFQPAQGFVFGNASVFREVGQSVPVSFRPPGEAEVVMYDR